MTKGKPHDDPDCFCQACCEWFSATVCLAAKAPEGLCPKSLSGQHKWIEWSGLGRHAFCLCCHQVKASGVAS